MLDQRLQSASPPGCYANYCQVRVAIRGRWSDHVLVPCTREESPLALSTFAVSPMTSDWEAPAPQPREVQEEVPHRWSDGLLFAP
jgi:hypothetical protein